MVLDTIGRLMPGVINDETSALFGSFQDGLLAPRIYTRPARYQNLKIPEVFLSGHQAKIDEWRMELSCKRTKERSPDLPGKKNSKVSGIEVTFHISLQFVPKLSG